MRVLDMRALKLIGIVLGGLVVVVVVLLLAVRLFVDPNAYKDRIAQQVKRSTGRELTLSGPIKLSVFPWIALELGPASLGNPPGFSAEPFAAVRHVAVRVKLLPLLHKELQIGKVEIDGLDVRLQKNAAGKGNWQDFGNDKSAGPQSAASSRGGNESLPDLAGVEITDSRFSYQDLTAEHVSLELGQVSPDKPIPIKLKLDLTTHPGAQAIELAAQLDVTLDLAAQTLNAPSFTAELASAHLSGSVAGNKIIDAPAFNGAFKLEPVSLRDLLGKLGSTPPDTRDPKAFSRLAAQGNFSYGANALAVSDLDIQLDDSQLRGKLAVTNLDNKATDFNLAIDHINLDRYRGPEQPAAPKPVAAAKPTENGAESSPEALQTLDVSGTLTIGSATAANLSLTQVLVTLTAKDGVTHIAPVKAKLYGGDYSGEITLDARNAVPTLKLDQSLMGIDMAPLMKDFAKSQRVSGHGNVTTHLTAQGLGGDALFKTLNGQVAANVDNGAVEGIDLWFEINRAIALIQKAALPGGQSSGRTRFDAFKASADIVNGVATTKDLNIASQSLRVTGQGSTNLVTNAIDYQLKATLLKDAPGAANTTGQTLADIPLNITGTTTSPAVRPDLEAMAKARLQQELDKHKGELQQKLQDKLRDVFK
jgi:AsmA protein